MYIVRLWVENGLFALKEWPSMVGSVSSEQWANIPGI